MKKLFVLTMCVVLGGCSGKGASLACGDTEVTNLVMDISKGEFREQLFKVFFRNETSILPRAIAEMSYAEFKSKATSENGNQGIVDKTESIVASLRVTDMRLKGKNETTGMISCAARLAYEKGGSDIEYTAQLTEEGKLYVEVSGLK